MRLYFPEETNVGFSASWTILFGIFSELMFLMAKDIPFYFSYTLIQSINFLETIAYRGQGDFGAYWSNSFRSIVFKASLLDHVMLYSYLNCYSRCRVVLEGYILFV